MKGQIKKKKNNLKDPILMHMPVAVKLTQAKQECHVW